MAIDETARQRGVRRVLWLELVLNLLVALAKAVFGLATGALAIAADAVHSALDAVANLAGLFVVGWAARPPDRGHPYGHQKIEVLAAVAIGGAIAASAVRFGWSAIDHLIRGGAAPETHAVGFVVIGGTWVINVFVALWEAHKARQLQSAYLAADAAHTASDVLVTAAVMGSYLAAHLGVGWADAVGALVVLVIIGRVAFRLIARNAAVLVDAAGIDPKGIEQRVLAIDGVSGCRDVRSRGPVTAIMIDLTIELDGDMTLREAHDLSDTVEDILERLPGVVDVTVHMEPRE